MTDYMKYRGKCKEYCEELINNNPNYRLVRGHYFCPIWNTEEPHWWCEDEEGNIIDPTKKQFDSKGIGIYTEFNGYVNCEYCGKEVAEEDIHMMGNYPCCSYECCGRLVGVF